ncbi:EAL domain-containing protein [Nocardioides sp. GY 10113]|uniref:putative bifunctional diguanylate cyclase/phosphodiesterase n=1 Tax=Nocardioides sp. GY 10113 TaxID=2569761 RepID=UPI0010A7FDE3|nr:EAL domain-containing protein [Nocardioides sp. GY 10113]TIC87620.1 EAL domain-containing protein [Nocardioides sp. GY 10113]
MSGRSEGTQVATPAIDLEVRLRELVGAAPNVILVTDEAGRIVYANAQAERLYGYPVSTLIGMASTELLPARHRARHATMRTSYVTNSEVRVPREMRDGRQFLALRSDGTEVPVEAGVSSVRLDDRMFIITSVTDISGRLRERARLEAGLRRSFLEAIPFCALATDRCGTVIAANPAAEQLLGLSASCLLGRPIHDLELTGTDEPASGEDTGPPLAQRVGSPRDVEYRRGDGTTIHVNQAVSELRDPAGVLTGYLVVAHDITARREALDAVRRMTTQDALTNLPNRSLLERHLGGAIAEAIESGTDGALLLLDLDHFQRVNDSLGHDVGDRVLLEVAERLRTWADDHSLVARFGGDEFVVVLREATALPAVATALFDELTRPMTVLGHDLTTTFSIGGAYFPRQGSEPSVVLRNADTAMYYAKSSGRNQLQWFDEDMRIDANERLSLASALRQALRDGELSVAYQPQIDLASGRTVGFEALARWKSPTLGNVGPDRFIPVAEETGMIVELGAWVLERACADIVRIQAEIGRPMRLAVNASPHQFRHDGWVETVASILERTGLAPGQLELEITEGVLMDHRRHVTETLHRLRELGVGIAVDDFGLGYSSLAYLARYPMDKLKIDRTFVRGLPPTSDRAPIIDAIVGMAQGLGMTVVAEGVETKAQESYLRDRGCDQAQGFLYSAAVSPKDAFRAARRR